MPDRSGCPVEMDRLTGTRITTMDFGEGRVETVIEYFRQLANQNERTKEHWKGKTVFQLKTTLPLLRNTTKGRARKPDADEPVDDETDTAMRDALTKDTDASRLLPHTADEARNYHC